MSSLVIIGILLLVAAAFYAGLYLSDLNRKVNSLLSKDTEPKPNAVVTNGAYSGPDKFGGVYNDAPYATSTVGLVSSKTPQRLEFEEAEELKKMNLGPR